nr:MAG TPA: hypothetical protein [Caudoviricetes sp.]
MGHCCYYLCSWYGDTSKADKILSRSHVSFLCLYHKNERIKLA